MPSRRTPGTPRCSSSPSGSPRSSTPIRSSSSRTVRWSGSDVTLSYSSPVRSMPRSMPRSASRWVRHDRRRPRPHERRRVPRTPTDSHCCERRDGKPAKAATAPGSAAMPAERSRNLRASLQRLRDVVGEERFVLAAVVVLTVASVTLVVLGPWLLGTATNLIVDGTRRGAIDTDALREPAAADRAGLCRFLGVRLHAGVPPDGCDPTLHDATCVATSKRSSTVFHCPMSTATRVATCSAG